MMRSKRRTPNAERRISNDVEALVAASAFFLVGRLCQTPRFLLSAFAFNIGRWTFNVRRFLQTQTKTPCRFFQQGALN